MARTTQRTGVMNPYRMVIFGSCALALGVLTTGWLDRRGDSAVTGVLQAHTTAITSAQRCRVIQVLTKVSDSAQPGTPLVQLDDEKLSARLLTKERELAEAESECQRTLAAADVELAWRIREIEGEVYQTRRQLTSLQQELVARQVEQIAWHDHLQRLESWTSAEEQPASIRPILLASAVPDAARLAALLKEDAAESAAQSLQEQVGLAQKRLANLDEVKELLGTKVRVSLGVDVARARRERLQEELALLKRQREQLLVVSPCHATVGVWRAQPGDLVEPGATIVELFDPDQMSVAFPAPPNLLSDLSPGDILEIEFPGRIRRQGRVAAWPPQAMGTTAISAEREVILTLQPTGKLWPRLPIGTQVRIVLGNTVARSPAL